MAIVDDTEIALGDSPECLDDFVVGQHQVHVAGLEAQQRRRAVPARAGAGHAGSRPARRCRGIRCRGRSASASRHSLARSANIRYRKRPRNAHDRPVVRLATDAVTPPGVSGGLSRDGPLHFTAHDACHSSFPCFSCSPDRGSYLRGGRTAANRLRSSDTSSPSGKENPRHEHHRSATTSASSTPLCATASKAPAASMNLAEKLEIARRLARPRRRCHRGRLPDRLHRRFRGGPRDRPRSARPDDRRAGPRSSGRHRVRSGRPSRDAKPTAHPHVHLDHRHPHRAATALDPAGHAEQARAVRRPHQGDRGRH